MRTTAILVALLLSSAVLQAQRAAIVVRHAERADSGPGAGQMMTSSQDPPLSAAGRERAERLARHLRDAGVTAIYVTQYVRTQQTAKPLADALRLTPTIADSEKTDDVVEEIKARYAKDVVLIVGHSSTVPDIVKALGGGEVTIRDDEYDALFVIAGGALVRLRY